MWKKSLHERVLKKEQTKFRLIEFDNHTHTHDRAQTKSLGITKTKKNPHLGRMMSL